MVEKNRNSITYSKIWVFSKIVGDIEKKIDCITKNNSAHIYSFKIKTRKKNRFKKIGFFSKKKEIYFFQKNLISLEFFQIFFFEKNIYLFIIFVIFSNNHNFATNDTTYLFPKFENCNSITLSKIRFFRKW